MKIYSILFLLFIACKVQGQQVDNSPWKFSYGQPKQLTYRDGNFYLKTKSGFVPLVYADSCDQQKLEIQTLRLLNDSLTKKLQLLLEWQEYACPIIENIGVVKTVNGYRLLVNKREMIKPAVRYYKRYKTERK